MLEKPDAPDLLATARQLLRDELLPALPPEKHFAARMIAGAMAIAQRAATADAPAMPAADLAALAAEIRAGAHDPGTPDHEATLAFLRAYARIRAEVSAPKALSQPAGTT